MLVPVLLIAFSFVILWVASNLVVVQTARLSKTFGTSFFASAFILLGVLTSLPELSIGINAVLEGRPIVFVGNLIGASFVLVALMIPLFAIFGNGAQLTHGMSSKTLLFALFVIALPSIATIDGMVHRSEGFMIILAYILLVIFTEQHATIADRVRLLLKGKGGVGTAQILKVFLGMALMLVASRILIDNTFTIVNRFGFSILVVSLLLFALGTNLPELFVGLRSIVGKKKSIALGDYIGSAAANSAIFGMLATTSDTSVLDGVSLSWSIILLLLSISLLYIFARSKNTLSRKEGFVLLFIYFLFFTIELANL